MGGGRQAEATRESLTGCCSQELSWLFCQEQPLEGSSREAQERAGAELGDRVVRVCVNMGTRKIFWLARQVYLCGKTSYWCFVYVRWYIMGRKLIFSQSFLETIRGTQPTDGSPKAIKHH